MRISGLSRTLHSGIGHPHNVDLPNQSAFFLPGLGPSLESRERKNRVRLSFLLLGPRFYYPLRTVLVTAKVLHRFAGVWPFAFSKHNRAILFSASTSARFSSRPLESTPDSSLIPQLHLVWGCRLFRARLCPPDRLWRDLPFSLSSTTPSANPTHLYPRATQRRPSLQGRSDYLYPLRFALEVAGRVQSPIPLLSFVSFSIH
jgi:hypothetical protein